MRRKLAILIVISTISVALALLSAPAAMRSFLKDATVGSGRSTSVKSSENLGVYTDSTCSQKVKGIAWAVSQGNQSSTRTLWIRNNCIAPSKLSLQPSKPIKNPMYREISYDIFWDAEGKCLAPNEVTEAKITVTTSNVGSGPAILNLAVGIEGTNPNAVHITNVNLAPLVFITAIACSVTGSLVSLVWISRSIVFPFSEYSNLKRHYYHIIDSLAASGYNKAQIYAVLDSYIQ